MALTVSIQSSSNGTQLKAWKLIARNDYSSAFEIVMQNFLKALGNSKPCHGK